MIKNQISHNYFLVILVMILLPACKTTKAPLWVSQYPVDNAYYTGIGIVEKKPGISNYSTEARKLALAEIAESIAVSVVSESKLKTFQETGIYRETFITNIITQTQAQLEDYELVEVWENDREFRAYYRLSKVKYKQWLDNRLSQIARRASRLYAEGMQSEQKADYAGALGLYLQAAAEIGDYWGYQFPLTQEARSGGIDTEILISLRSLVSGIRLEATPAEMRLNFNSPSAQPFVVNTQMSSARGNEPLNGLYLKTNIADDAFIKYDLSRTDDSGNARLNILKAASSGAISVSIMPDLQKAGGLADDAFNHPVIQSLAVPQTSVVLHVEPLKVFVVAVESILGEANSLPVATIRMRQILAAQGWVFVDDPALADVSMHIRTTAVEGVERANVFTAFADGNVRIINTEGIEIFSTQHAQISGGGRNFEAAARTALQRLAENFLTDLKDSF
jgi:hypothetical protein